MISSAMQGGMSAFFVRRRRRLVADTLDVLDGWGYEELDVPLLSPFEALRPAIGDDVDRELFRFVDRSGDLLYLRGDLTPTVAHVLAQRLNSAELPVRVSYANRVARVQRDFAREQLESYEAGFELVGSSGSDADLEALVIAADLIESLGVERSTFAVGDVRIARRLATRSGAPIAEMLGAIAARDRQAVDRLAAEAGADTGTRAALAMICGMHVDQTQLATLAADGDAMLAGFALALQNLLQAFSSVAPRVSVALDLSTVGARSYYTGLQFSVVSEAWGTALGSGGRYDDLYGHFGPAVSAIGFGLHVDRLVRAGHGDQDASSAAEMLFGPESIGTALAARQAGERVRIQQQVSPMAAERGGDA